jgi:uncharacterized OsmC-like protein
MGERDIASAVQRAESVFRRRPLAGLHDDAPATAVWQSGMRVISHHEIGAKIPTDMPAELGGSGDQVSPGWLFRAGLASCAVTCIALRAAAAGIKLDMLEIVASSRSDTRGLLGMVETDGNPVHAGSRGLHLRVRIAARQVAADRLRELVVAGMGCSPVYAGLQATVPIAVQIQVEAA